MAETSVQLNVGTGGSNVATFADATSRQHQEVIVQTQNGGSDPVSVGSGNPLPVTVATALPAGANAIGSVTVSGSVSLTGTSPVNGNVASGVADSGFPVKVAGVYNSGAPTFTTGQRADLQTDVNGNLNVNIKAGAAAGGTSSAINAAYPASATAVGATDGTNMKPLAVDGSGNLKVNIAAGGVAAQTDNSVFTAGTSSGLPIMGVYNDGISALTSGDAGTPRLTASRQLIVAPQANLNGGWTPYKLISANTTNAQSVKASAGSIGFAHVGNNGATVAYLKLYNKASAPTVGTDVPVQTYMIPGATTGAGFTLPIPAGLSFATGIAIAVTGGAADADTTAVATGQVAVNLGYL
jgi:hypothetical protein